MIYQDRFLSSIRTETPFFCTNLGRSSISLPRQEKISVPPSPMNQPVRARGRDRKRDKIGNRSKKKKRNQNFCIFVQKKERTTFSIKVSWPTPASSSRGNKGRVVRGRRSADRYETLARGPFDGTSPERDTHTHFNPLQLDYQLNKSLFFAFNQRDETV